MALTVSTQLFRSGDPHEIRTHMAAALGGARAGLVVVFASPVHPLGAITQALSLDHDVVVGSSSSGEFVGDREAKGSVAVFAVSGDLVATAGIGTNLRADPMGAVRQALAGQGSAVDGHPHRTGIVLLDPLSGVGEQAALLVAEQLGDAPLAGGAAGDDLAMSATQVAVGGQCTTDAIVVVQLFTAEALGLGVRHGHRVLSGPHTVTRADGATIYELDGEPAWEVWKRETRAAAEQAGIDVDTLSPEAEGGFLLRFEAGLKAGEEIKVRAPLQRFADGSIAFATAVPQGSVIRITESTAESQIESAYLAACDARDGLGGRAVAGALVFDCICRNLILGPRFGEAVTRMAEALEGAPLAGFETYGEVALHAGSMSGFHNTTSVVLAFPRSR